jgi:hypothetical protein
LASQHIYPNLRVVVCLVSLATLRRLFFRRIDLDESGNDLAKQTGPIFGADGQKTGAGSAVIIMPQLDRSAVTFIPLVPHRPG